MQSMKKKIISVLLMTSILCSFGFLVNAENKRANLDTSETELATKVLSELEIMEYSQNNEKDIISRIDFAVYLGRLLGVDEYAQTDVTYYTDVPDDHYALTCVNYLTQIGGFNGYGNSIFRPDDSISPIEAAKVIFNAIGYRAYAEMAGGYPTAYLQLASESELLDGFEGLTEMTRTELFVLLFRAGFINMPESTSSSGGVVNFEVEDSESIFEKLWDVYEVCGIVTATGVVTIDDTVPGQEDKIVLNGTVYDENGQKADKYLGRFVRAVTLENDAEDRLLWMVTDTKETDEVCIGADSVKDYKNNTLFYYDENNKEKNYDIDLKAAIVYNGEMVEYYEDGLFEIDKGEIYLVDTTGDKDADTVIIDSYKSYIVGYVDTSREIIYDKVTGAQIAALENYEHTSFYLSSGADATLSDIGANSVISIKENGEYIEIYISTENVTGTISKAFEEGEGKYITVDEIDYKFDLGFLKDTTWFSDGKFIGRPGESYKLNLDMFGDIVYVGAVSSTDIQAGYIIKCLYNDEDEKVLLKLLSGSGEILTPEFNKTVRVDGVTLKESQKVKNAIMQGDGEFILYMLDKEGKITYIDTTYRGENENEATLMLYKVKGKENVKLENQSYGGIISPASGMKRFIVPAENKESADEKKFSVATGFGYGEDKNIVVAGYKTDASHIRTDYCVIYEGAKEMPQFNLTRFTIVNEINKVINVDDEVVYQLKGVHQGAEVTYTFASDIMTKFANVANDKVFVSPAEFEAGDMLQLAVNGYGEIYAAQLVFDYSDGVDKLPKWGNHMYGTFNGMVDTFVRCYVNRMDSGYGEIILDKEKAEEIAAVSNFNNKPISVVDTSGKKPVAKPGSIADIQQVSVLGDDTLPMFVFMWRYSPRDVIVYK